MRKWLAILAPNPVVAGFVIFGAGAEWALLGVARPSIYQQGALVTAFAVLFIGWFWLSLGWVIGALTRGVDAARRAAGGWGAVTVNGAILVAAMVGAFGYACSWGVYLRVGQFLNSDALQFALTQFNFFYFFQTEAALGPVLVGLTVAVVIVTPVAWWRMNRSVWVGVNTQRLWSARVILWLAVTLGWVGAWQQIVVDPSVQRPAMRLAWLAYRLHPTLGWGSTWWETRREQPIPATLDTTRLTRRDAPYEPGLPGASVIIVAIESLRADVVHLTHQGQVVMPTLSALASNGVWFTRAYTQSTHSDYADGCPLSALYPLRTRRHHYYSARDPWPRTMLYDLLQPVGYATAIVSAQNEAWSGMDQFLLTPRLDWLYDASRSAAVTTVTEQDRVFAHEIKVGALRAGSLNDAHTMTQALAWLTDQQRAGRRFFLGMNLQSSHFPYPLPADAPRPFQPSTIDFPVSFIHYPPEQTPVVRNAYYNALRECDRQLARLVAHLRATGQWEQTILVVLGENGEMFHEHGRVTHAREPFEAAVRVAAVLHAPGLLAPRVENYPLELVDVTPTVLGLLGWPPHPNHQGLDALAATRPPVAERLLFLHVEVPGTRTDAVIGAGRWKYWVDRQTRQEQLFDLTTDPGETTDRLTAEPMVADRLRRAYQTWRQQQLAYYHYPMYYEQYYPPRPPGWAP